MTDSDSEEVWEAPEQYQRSSKADNGGKPIVWEACQTLNNSWGYDRDNLNWKSPEMVVKLLIDTISKGGNMLLNIGPNGRGEIDSRTQSILDEIKEWMRLHRESIYGCGPSEYEAPVGCKIYTEWKSSVSAPVFMAVSYAADQWSGRRRLNMRSF